MADNVREYEQANAVDTGIEPRPPPAALVELASSMPGNLDRLHDYFGQHSPKLLLTLGTEAAAFVRGVSFGDARSVGDDLFYQPPAMRIFARVPLQVVHLVHPHMFIKKIEKWTARHLSWCAGIGRRLVADYPLVT